MSLDPRDAILQAHTPAIPVPLYGGIEPLSKSGHRYLVAADGLWLEVSRPWIHARALIAMPHADHVPPFGELSADSFGGRDFDAVYAFGTEDLDRVQALFLYDARQACPDEFAAWAIWNDRERRLEYRALLAAETSHVRLEGIVRPRLEDHEHLAIDLHSHGRGAAGFSPTDDEDDRGEVKLAVVVGNLGETPTWCTRLCLLGLFMNAEATGDPTDV